MNETYDILMILHSMSYGLIFLSAYNFMFKFSVKKQIKKSKIKNQKSCNIFRTSLKNKKAKVIKILGVLILKS